jgi:hypothetical protein
MIIGLIGYANSGKDEIANILVREHGFERRAFADKIRDLLYNLNPQITLGYDTVTTLKLMVDHGGWDKAKQNPKVRELLQDLGLAARKTFNEDFWIKQAFKNMNTYTNYVFTDVRFTNEVNIVRFYGGHLWRVKRPDVGPINDHISELELEDYKVDQILINRGTLENLRELVNTRIALV